MLCLLTTSALSRAVPGPAVFRAFLPIPLLMAAAVASAEPVALGEADLDRVSAGVLPSDNTWDGIGSDTIGRFSQIVPAAFRDRLGLESPVAVPLPGPIPVEPAGCETGACS